MDKSEQWKKGGKCAECRRQSYCNKDCAEHKRLQNAVIKTAISKLTAGMLDKYFHYN